MDLALDDRQSSPFQASDQARQDHRPASEEGYAPEDGSIDPESRGPVSHRAFDDGMPDVTPYIALIHPPEDVSEWGVTFPDVPGCISGGASFEAAVESAREALSGHLAALAADGDPLPAARTWSELQADQAASEDGDGAIAQLVVPRHVPGERVRVNIMIDKGLLRLTDEAAQARGLSRSAFIEAALTAAAEN